MTQKGMGHRRYGGNGLGYIDVSRERSRLVASVADAKLTRTHSGTRSLSADGMQKSREISIYPNLWQHTGSVWRYMDYVAVCWL